MAAGRRREDCGYGCRCSGACRWRRNDDGAEQRERTGGSPEETPLRAREEDFLSLDHVHLAEQEGGRALLLVGSISVGIGRR